MNIGSLFSGIGGIELGFEKQGFTTEWFVEYDLYCQAVLRKRFPDTPIFGDVTKIDFGNLPRIDILTGGFPCQDISNAGKRVGITGSRSSLWKHYLRAIRELRPRYAVIENVAALANRGLNVVLADLAQVGYDAEWYNISASAVGAPHRRERLFIIAYPNSERLQGHDEQQTQHARTPIGQIKNTNVSNTESNRLNRGICGNRKDNDRIQEQKKSQQPILWSETSGCNKIRGIQTKWTTQPGICGISHGIPNRIHRIKCLGNAVVPQCAEVFAKAIKEREGIE